MMKLLILSDMRRFGRVTVVNPGSVGLNRNGSGKACYAVYDDQGMTRKRVDYNVNRTVATLRSSPLPQTVICKLEFMLGPRVLETPRPEHVLND
jgi:diadenosine tetraphosphatase ApaH/serine/threonine PP2A family protein phosphatase